MDHLPELAKRVTSRVSPSDKTNPAAHPASRPWKVILSYKGRQMTAEPFSTGPGIEKEPDSEMVLRALLSDASGFENTRSIEEYCEEYSCGRSMYRAVEHQTDRLKRFLREDYSLFLYGE